MGVSASDILEVLARYSIAPLNSQTVGDFPFTEFELPDVGEIEEGETVYSTSLENVFDAESGADKEEAISPSEPARFEQWWREMEGFIEDRPDGSKPSTLRNVANEEPPEPHCAWYCPVHYYGYGWGIYIREECVFSSARDIAHFVKWKSVRVVGRERGRQLLRAAFYVYFLHEQFHHKVESLGFRLLVSTGTDRYRPYKRDVYRPAWGTVDCLEESLANADSYLRLGESRYAERLDPAIRRGLRKYLKMSMKVQPPGYREGLSYLDNEKYRDGRQNLQSRVLEGVAKPLMPASHWTIAPKMIQSLADISAQIYVILPVGARPLFRPADIDPGATVSTRDLETALTRHYGYGSVSGGKGSHVKLKKPNAPTIILPGNRPVLSPGVVKQVLASFGGYPISELPKLLDGSLQDRSEAVPA